MLPDIEVPAHLVKLCQALIDADSDDSYIRGLHAVYSDTAAKRVEWDLKVKLAVSRLEKAQNEYEIALEKYLKEQKL